MKNQITFIDEGKTFPEKLGITENRLNKIESKTAYFLSEGPELKMSKIIEKIIDGLNPNESAYAIHIAASMETVAKIHKLMRDVSLHPIPPTMQIRNLQVGLEETMLEFADKAKHYKDGKES